MAYSLDIKYFNSFWLKKVTPTASVPEWPGLPWNPSGYPTYPFDSGTYNALATSNFYVEEARIKGGFNNSIVDLGVRAYSVIENPKKKDRSYSLIHSGSFNTRTGFNETNVFSVSEPIVTDLDSINGSIQKLYTRDTNLDIFQENKCSYTLVNKNAMYSGSQGSQETASTRVLGQNVPYSGEYGISRNPESFAEFGYRRYIVDKDRSAVLRVSMDGITEISNYGMRDFFRDNLAGVSDQYQKYSTTKNIVGTLVGLLSSFDITADLGDIELGSNVIIGAIQSGSYVTNIVDAGGGDLTITISSQFDFNSETEVTFDVYRRGRIPGGWDQHNQNYTISLQSTPREVSDREGYSTLCFDENVQGWTSFYSYKPLSIGSLKNKFYSFIDSNVYEQYYENMGDNNRGKFYGAVTPDDSSIVFIFNPEPFLVKNFQTIAYEGSNGFEVDYCMSDYEGMDALVTSVNYPALPYSYGDQYRDQADGISSYDEGYYLEDGYPAHAGFDRRENRYVANIVQKQTFDNVGDPSAAYPVRPGEILSGSSMTGIKGYVATIKVSTDATTNPGGRKELFSVASGFSQSS